jgi:hypothetical protein
MNIRSGIGFARKGMQEPGEDCRWSQPQNWKRCPAGIGEGVNRHREVMPGGRQLTQMTFVNPAMKRFPKVDARNWSSHPRSDN